MLLAAGGAVAFAGIFIAQASKFVASADAIAVAGLGGRLDGNERHCKGIVRFHAIPCKRSVGKASLSMFSCLSSFWTRVPRTEKFSRSKLKVNRLHPLIAWNQEEKNGGITRRYRFLSCARRKGEPRCSRRSSQCSSGMVINTSTTAGSNWLPEQRRISSRAWDIGKALR